LRMSPAGGIGVGAAPFIRHYGNHAPFSEKKTWFLIIIFPVIVFLITLRSAGLLR